MHPFEKILSVSKENIALELKDFPLLPWADFLLNPRRLRGSDFLMRWSQGVWSESRLLEAVNENGKYFAIPYGPSGTAPTDDVRAFELYFERLEAAGLGKIKRPDILVFKKTDEQEIHRIVESVGGVQELPFIVEEKLRPLLDKAIVAVEAENSLWKSKKMPDYATEFTPQKRLGGKLGLKKVAILPTIIIKEEDRKPLKRWQEQSGIKIHVWHVFYDQAFGISLDEAERLFAEGLIQPTIQTFQAPGGATTKKAIYKIYYRYAYPLGEAIEEPSLVSDSVEDKNGHILPYVKFHGGKLVLHEDAIKVLDSLT
ncbi:type II restriction endonuclease [Candidatus Kaiserbacteria bacterium RIFCSPHIGHO2_02_FULL_54_11b]|uniref:Type II restriction endonuclease n=1 Tax=Candidatus Kaiserbacteria bacterium RIFCSPHIGHO2_02_FULL_54_11b TaxID=1798494 RepID=A0A1F6DS68_9BACT|nr:MAG: type II restriction endonuclease [Candidatus Kaiserbacteria bacterium RIFCSPHIGHO2_02_FULL_54_11b]